MAKGAAKELSLAAHRIPGRRSRTWRRECPKDNESKKLCQPVSHDRGLLRLAHPNHTHHARGLVLEDVAVDHPVARVVGYARGLDALVRPHPHRVLPPALAGR